MADLERTVTLELSDRWLWIVDDQLVHGPISADALDLNDEKRVVEMPALARALALKYRRQDRQGAGGGSSRSRGRAENS